ncbi:aquaporin-like protein [Saitoella complicata NRRL Y-17804]|uniref:aquaporin-like protein n=1 Tax=Saitoella complicata (strain BCRC 22490 / CBS 7301 / JCM 7358 / NBRC 10748 / NRRL Y-17804) TaxID=698492 RepID=UPI000867A678|nr:aquaporin-like protein [Saitoella complicata NRRL Y-17804]ODQ52308.1 aquaporin-like protein [Saitoella complicata NRRL Y-17804]
MSNDHDLHRVNTGQVELGATDVLADAPHVDVVLPPAVSHGRLAYERRRPRWAREMFAEATGCYFYVYGGISAAICFNLDLLEKGGGALGNILTIGIGFGLAIAFGIIVSGGTSGGHLNPAFTLTFACYQGFPWRKVPYYILAQIFGCFMAAMTCYAQYHQQIRGVVEALEAAGAPVVGPTGPNSWFCAYPGATQTNLGYVFLNEFFCDSYIALLVWAVLDPANPFIAPTTAPFCIGLVYSVIVWGFALDTISTNPARDLGARIVTAIFFGSGTFPHYSAISILVPIPATLFGCGIYEFVFKDHMNIIKTGHMSHPDEELRRIETAELKRQQTNQTANISHLEDVRVDNGKYA